VLWGNDSVKQIEGGVTAPKGFQAAGVAAGIKAGSTKRDCALIVSDVPASVAGTFTQNIMKAPPVSWNVEVCKGGSAQAVFINSGNANAATGRRGEADVGTTAAQLGESLGIPSDTVCICSTGVIGVPLPMDRIAKGVQECAAQLTGDGSGDAAQAIMTTDTVPKEMAVEIPLADGAVRLGAIAKGAGMIMPNMATMICVITTDAAINAELLAQLLRESVGASFNRICIDNDMSTSDTVLCLANGQAGLPVIQAGSDDCVAFGAALTSVCQDMAKALVRDGEGATKFVQIQVSGTANDEDAKTIARAIGTSQLCKTAFFGQDPNWGRFACAAGYAGVDFDPDALAIWLNDLQLVDEGQAASYEEEDAAAIMCEPEFSIRVAVGDGSGSGEFWTSDLSHDYVSINADYRS
jgi:glutamate N-acetyltransferase / amino-acid N-acetyltransferase